MLFPKLLPLVVMITTCQSLSNQSVISLPNNKPPQPKAEAVIDIALPAGFNRVELHHESFGAWLRTTKLRKDGSVFFYNGQLKPDQSSHYAVLDISVGDKDLQQCADAIIRLRAEYLFAQGRYDEIVFTDNSGKKYAWRGKQSRVRFKAFLETVFSYCNTASLQKQLHKLPGISNVMPGDVFIKGGFPGHAMIVMDVGLNRNGEKVFLLAQSFMPAQDIHIVRNLRSDSLSPWYDTRGGLITTPGWTFYPGQLYRF